MKTRTLKLQTLCMTSKRVPFVRVIEATSGNSSMVVPLMPLANTLLFSVVLGRNWLKVTILLSYWIVVSFV